MKNLPKGGIGKPPNTTETAEDTNLKFYMRIDRKGYYTKNEKLAKRGRGVALVKLSTFSNFRTPNISGTAEYTNLK